TCLPVRALSCLRLALALGAPGLGPRRPGPPARHALLERRAIFPQDLLQLNIELLDFRVVLGPLEQEHDPLGHVSWYGRYERHWGPPPCDRWEAGLAPYVLDPRQELLGLEHTRERVDVSNHVVIARLVGFLERPDRLAEGE